MLSASGVLEGVAHAASAPSAANELRKQVTDFANEVRMGLKDPDAEDDLLVEDSPDKFSGVDASFVHKTIQRLDYLGMWLVVAWLPTMAACVLAARRQQLFSSISVRYCLAASTVATAAYIYAHRHAVDDSVTLGDWEELATLILIVVGPVVAMAHGVRVVYNTKTTEEEDEEEDAPSDDDELL